MSEPTWQSRAQQLPFVGPEMMIGAASPLWGYFTGAAIAGVIWWWMYRWLQPVANLEALAEAALKPVVSPVAAVATIKPAAEAIAEPLVEAAVEVAAEAAGGPVGEVLATPDLPPLPVGGESAPVSPAILSAEPLREPPTTEPAPRPKLEAAPSPPEAPAVAPAPPRPRKPRSPSEGEPPKDAKPH